MAELLVRSAEGPAAQVRLEAARYTFGRATTNDYSFIQDPELSRQHLAFERTGAGWTVIDLGSSNGTAVNGSPIAGPTPLRAGDRITAGRLVIEYTEPQPPDEPKVVFVDKPEKDAEASILAMNLESLPEPEPSAGQMQVLIEAGRELAHRRPLAELFPLILELAVKAVGCTRGVLMIEESGELVTRAAMGDRFEISRTARDRVLKGKESLLIKDAQLDALLRSQASIVFQKVRSILAVPLQTRDKVIGLIYLDSPRQVLPFTRENLNLLTVLGNIAAIRIENERLGEVERHEQLMSRDLEQAAEIQQNLLPAAVPTVAGVELAAFSAACRSVGGDYYDFYQRPGRIVLLVGDVAGKGMPAALLMASLQARVQVLVEEEIDLASMVTRLNRIISSNCPGNRFITFFICEIELATGAMSYVNAGHNPPLVVRRDGRVERLEGGGIILGILGRAGYELQASRLEEGDLLVLFTDGVTEAQQPGTEEDFGETRLVEALGPVAAHTTAQMIEQVKQAVTGFAGSVTAADDFTLLLARKTARA